MGEHRKRLRRHENPAHGRFLTFSCVDRRALFTSAGLCDEFANQLFLTRTRLGFRLIAWVIMPEHVHLLVHPGKQELTVPRILSAVKRPVARRVLPALREHEPDLARFWQPGGGYDRNIFSRGELVEKRDYIHQNPVRRGLVGDARAWRWSSARALAGLETRWPEIDREML